jgi:DNA-binding transcriptional regulator YdaS (Cro superfamily)
MSAASEISLMEKVRAAGGGAVALSRELSLSGKPLRPQAVSQWTQVPAERVLEVERITGISRHDLRPDVFGPAVESKVAEVQP